MPLSAPTWGSSVEDYARRLAGALGVADFVYGPRLESKGTSNREISDGVLACGNDGLILQVKARDLHAGARDSPARAEAWIRKVAAKGVAQANGTRRRFGIGPVQLQSLRGFTRTFDGVGQWPAVVVIVHPQTPELDLPREPNTICMSLDDWLGLHDRLRSTAAVIAYVSRALASGQHPPLGMELDRYEILAAADQDATGGPNSVPLLPLENLDGDDETFSLLITEMIEQAWTPDGFHPWSDADQYRRIVEDLDRIPPASRADLGRKMFETYSKMQASAGRRSFLFLDGSQNALFLFVYDGSERWPTPVHFLAQVAALAMTRFAQAQEAGLEPSFAHGVGVLVDNDRGISYSFCHAETGELLDPEIRRLTEEEFGLFDGSGVAAPVRP